MNWSSAADSHTGNVRSHNEDSVFADSAGQLWVVADGMGGHAAGDVASKAITDALSDVASNATRDIDLSDCVDRVEDALLDVNDQLRHYGKTRCDGNTVGSTVVTVVVRDHVGVVLWAGDSRLYRVRNNQIEQITRDHNPVADLLDSGGVTEEEALNADTNIITRAVGGQLDLHLDVVVFDVNHNDTLLLCTDGLYREVSVEALTEAMQLDVDRAVDQLMQTCLAGVAKDNVSLVMFRAESGASLS